MEVFGFLKIGFTDIIDILVIAMLIYFVFRAIRGSALVSLFVALMLLMILRVVFAALDMRMTSRLIDTVFDVGLIGLIIIFQPEIRHFLMRLGSNATSRASRSSAFFSKLFGGRTEAMGSETVKEITEAVRRMSAEKTGALIVFPHNNRLESVIETGDRIDAVVNRRLIMNLFFKNSPLHDGAMIIGGNRIIAARCTLPITARTDIPASYGMRHKAAIGICEESDADVIVVSEETGHILYVSGETQQEIQNINELNLLLGTSIDSAGDGRNNPETKA